MLVQRTTEQVFRAPRHNIYFLHHILYHWYLDGGCKQLAESPYSAVFPWIRCWREVIYNTSLCSRVGTKNHPRRIDNDVADVDSFWNHARFYRIGCFSERNVPWSNITVEMDAGKYQHSPAHCLSPGVLLSRVATLVRFLSLQLATMIH